MVKQRVGIVAIVAVALLVFFGGVFDTPTQTIFNDGCTFITNVPDEDFFGHRSNSFWVSVDKNRDSSLEGYYFRSAASWSSSRCGTTDPCSTGNLPCLIVTTPANNKVIDFGSSTRVVVCDGPNNRQVFYDSTLSTGAQTSCTGVVTTTTLPPQSCDFVTNQPATELYTNNDWIVVDRNDDNNRIGYGYNTVTLTTNRPGQNSLITTTPLGNEVHRCGTNNNVCLYEANRAFLRGFKFDSRSPGASSATLECGGTTTTTIPPPTTTLPPTTTTTTLPGLDCGVLKQTAVDALNNWIVTGTGSARANAVQKITEWASRC